MDNCCGTGNFVAVGVGEWLYDGLFHSYPAGNRHRCGSDPSYSRTKGIVAIWTRKPAKEGDQFL